METIRFVLLLHVAAGSVALVTAALSIVTAKGQPLHRKVGTVYVFAMVVVSLTAWIVAVARPNPFLFLIASFSGALTLIGWRIATHRTGAVDRIDRGAAAFATVTGILMILYGAWMVLGGAQIGIALAVFGVISVQSGVQSLGDLASGGLRGRVRIARHLQRMLGATIATTTAVLVQQVAPRLESIGAPEPLLVLAWLAPTIILTPLIVVQSRRTLTGTLKGPGLGEE